MLCEDESVIRAYSDEDFDMVTDMAGELGFSLSVLHYCVMLYAYRRGNTTSFSNLIDESVKKGVE